MRSHVWVRSIVRATWLSSLVFATGCASTAPVQQPDWDTIASLTGASDSLLVLQQVEHEEFNPRREQDGYLVYEHLMDIRALALGQDVEDFPLPSVRPVEGLGFVMEIAADDVMSIAVNPDGDVDVNFPALFIVLKAAAQYDDIRASALACYRLAEANRPVVPPTAGLALPARDHVRFLWATPDGVLVDGGPHEIYLQRTHPLYELALCMYDLSNAVKERAKL